MKESYSYSKDKDRVSMTIITVLSVLIPVAVAFLLFAPAKLESGQWVKILPHLNGILNSATSVALVMGFYFIKQKNIVAHRNTMMSAFAMGAVFLISYVVYHASSLPTKYGGEGAIKIFYYFILITHIVLAVVVVPFVLLAIYYALSGKIDKHKKIVKYTLPIWLYVSVTGVLAYLMISRYYT